jgi:hypothetical protein
MTKRKKELNMKKVTFYIRPQDYDNGASAYEVELNYNQDFPKEAFLKDYDKLIAHVNKYYPDAKFIEMKVASKPQQGFTKALLESIGNEIASVYGAVCTGVKCFTKSVEFHCNEYGEKFTTLMTYDEIKQDYAYML